MNMETKKEPESAVEDEEQIYELQAPDGGWGYVIVAATVVAICVTVIPMGAFGLVYGSFLRNIGDETTGTTISNGMFNTVNSFTGLLANGLLNRYSYRKVGILGSVIFIIGATALIFSQTLLQFITLFGVVQGIGFGLLLPAVMSAFNSYFDKKMNVMMSIAQTLIAASNIAVPHMAAWSMDTFGYRGTLIGLAAISALCLPAAVTLQSVKRHMKKVYKQTINSTVTSVDTLNQSKKTLSLDIVTPQTESLMQQEGLSVSQGSLRSGVFQAQNRLSVVSLGDRFASIPNINDIKDEDYEEKDIKQLSFCRSFLKSMDLSLLSDAKYLNISIGLALCFSGDVAFISIMPMMLGNIGFSPQKIAVIMAVFFGSDLISRILLTCLSYVLTFRNRVLVLFAAVLTAIARIALTFNDDYMWKLTFIGVLGFLRCFIQTPLPLVLSEEYPDRFAAAFTLFMAVGGVVSLTVGPLMSMVKSYTQSDVMVCHLLTAAFIICVISWTSELMFCRRKTKKKEDE